MSVVDDITILFKGDVSPLNSAANEAADSVKGLGSKLASAFSIGAAVTIVAEGVINLGKVAISAAHSIGELAVKGIANVNALGDQAFAIKTNIEAYSQLRYVQQRAGGEMEGIASVIGKLNERLGSGAARKGIEALGLNFKKFAELDTVSQIATVSDALKDLDKNTFASSAKEVFGKNWAAISGVLQLGSETIKELTADADFLGVTISEKMSAQAGAAADQFDRFNAASEGLTNVLGAELAPYLASITKGFLDWALTGTNVSDTITMGIDIVVGGLVLLGTALDHVNLMWKPAVAGVKALYNAIKPVADSVIGVTAAFLGLEKSALMSGILAGALGVAMPSGGFGEQIQDWGEKIKADAKAFQSAADGAKRTKTEVDTLQVSVNKLMDKMQDDVKFFGLKDHDLSIAKLKDDGASAEDLRALQALAGRIHAKEKLAKLDDDELKKQERMGERAKQLLQDMRTPAEALFDLNNEIQELVKKHKLTVEQAAKIYAKEFKATAEAIGSKTQLETRKFGAAALEGSQKAHEIIINSQYGSRTDPQQKANQLLQQSLDVMKDIRVNTSIKPTNPFKIFDE